MFYQPYKQYLDFLNKSPKHSTLQKSAVIIFLIFFITFGAASSFFYWQYQKTKSVLIENQYLEKSTAGFLSASQSLDDVFGSFQVLGTKTKIIDELKEASNSPSAFYVPVEDATKTIANIDNVKKHILFQKNQSLNQLVPPKFNELQQGFIGFYDESTKLLDSLYNQQKFTKELLVSLGPNFYLPVLTNDSLWKEGKSREIIDYYQKIKEEANQTLTNLAGLNVPGEFENHYQRQISYLELLVETSTKIIEILSEDNVQSRDITQIEKAYQVLVGAKRQNETIAEQLLEERLNLLSKETNLSKFAPTKMIQNSIASKLTDIHANSPQQQELALFSFIENVQKFLPNILRGLQIPDII